MGTRPSRVRWVRLFSPAFSVLEGEMSAAHSQEPFIGLSPNVLASIEDRLDSVSLPKLKGTKARHKDKNMQRTLAIAAVISLISTTCFGQAKTAAPPPKLQDIPRPPPPGQPPPKNTVVLPPPVQPQPRTIPQRIENPQLRDLRDSLPPSKPQGVTIDRVGPAKPPDRPEPQQPTNPSQAPPPSTVGPVIKKTF